jgi:uncharacterized protein (TIGR04551 family)
MLGSARPRFVIRAILAVLFVMTWPVAARAQNDADAGSAAPSGHAPLMPSSPDEHRALPAATPSSPAPAGTSPAAAGTSPASPGQPGASPAPTSQVQGLGTPTPLAPINPRQDQEDLLRQGSERPSSDGSIGARPQDVYSEDWWGRARPLIELHGYFRTRAELFHNLFLGRHDLNGVYANGDYYSPAPLDQSYSDTSGTFHGVNLCGPFGNQACYDKTQSSANIRFRINPEIHISDNLRILSQIDMLDNLVLGSTPDAYAMQPGQSGSIAPGKYGYSPAGYNGYAPLGAFTTTQGPPTAGVNSYQNSINVKRVWGEYMTPVGQLRFGRMPSQWGLGMVANAGDGIDSDYQTTTDRIMFVSGIKSVDLYFGGAWDFVSTGPTNASPYDVYGGQPTNVSNLSNVGEWVLFAAHRTNPELQKLSLSRGDLVVNGGLYAIYRDQYLDVKAGQTPQTVDTTQVNNGLERRDVYAFIPDAWVQALWKKFRFEAEFAAIWGSIGTLPGGSSDIAGPGFLVREYGLATQTEFRAVEDKLHLNFGFGWASGDPWVQGLNPGSTGLQPELNGGKGPISTFRFHPDYRVDLIFFREILTRVEGAYYFRPSVDYDFLRNPNGQKFGGGGAIIWSRASEFEQTPGHKRDLGVELDLSLYYQAKDGSLNDDPEKLGGFFAMLQYGVFFPLGGLSYLPGEQNSNLPDWSTSAAQAVRLFLGIMF